MMFFIFLMSVFAAKDCVDCSLPAQESVNFHPAPITYISNNNCNRPLLAGQGRISRRSATTSSSSIPADRNYLLYRSGEQSYQVIYQLNFTEKTGRDAPISMSARDMEERTRNCLALIPPSRLADGREISFRFINP